MKFDVRGGLLVGERSPCDASFSLIQFKIGMGDQPRMRRFVDSKLDIGKPIIGTAKILNPMDE